VACRILRDLAPSSRFAFAVIGGFFGDFNPAIIRSQYHGVAQEYLLPGRPVIFFPEVTGWIERVIQQRHAAMNATAYSELADSVRCHCGITITSDTLRYRIADIASIKAVTVSTMEAGRVAVDPEAIVPWYADLARRIEDVPRRFILNADETGCCDFGDQRELTILVP
jgi:hypothetical protein